MRSREAENDKIFSFLSAVSSSLAVDVKLKKVQILPWKNLTDLLIKKRNHYFDQILGLFNEEFLPLYNGLRNSTVTAVISTKMPFIVYTNKNDELIVSGYIGDLWENLEEALNFKTDFQISEKQITDERQVLRNSPSDIILNPIIPRASDILEFGKTMPIIVTWAQLSIKIRSNSGNSLFYLSTWSLSLWCTFALSVPLLSFISWTITEVSCRLITEKVRKNGKYKLSKLKSVLGDKSFMTHFLSIWGSLTNQGFQVKPYTNSMRVTTLVTITFGYIMTSSYSAILISYLATIQPPGDIKLKDLSEQNALSLCVSKTSIGYRHFQESPDSEVISDKWRHVLNRKPCKGASEDVIPIEDYCNEQNIVFDSKQYTNLVFQGKSTDDCQIHTFRQRYYTSRISIITNKNFKYTRLIDIYLMKFYAVGILQKYQEKWLPSVFPTEEKRPDSIAVVNFSHIKYVLLFYLSAMMLSGMILLLEISVYLRYNELSLHAKGNSYV